MELKRDAGRWTAAGNAVGEESGNLTEARQNMQRDQRTERDDKQRRAVEEKRQMQLLVHFAVAVVVFMGVGGFAGGYADGIFAGIFRGMLSIVRVLQPTGTQSQVTDHQEDGGRSLHAKSCLDNGSSMRLLRILQRDGAQTV